MNYPSCYQNLYKDVPKLNQTNINDLTIIEEPKIIDRKTDDLKKLFYNDNQTQIYSENIKIEKMSENYYNYSPNFDESRNYSIIQNNIHQSISAETTYKENINNNLNQHEEDDIIDLFYNQIESNSILLEKFNSNFY
jgi:hypothetical protein